MITTENANKVADTKRVEYESLIQQGTSWSTVLEFCKQHGMKPFYRQVKPGEDKSSSGLTDVIHFIEERIKIEKVNAEKLHIAMEWGFRQHEKGKNLDLARTEFNELLKQ